MIRYYSFIDVIDFSCAVTVWYNSSDGHRLIVWHLLPFVRLPWWASTWTHGGASSRKHIQQSFRGTIKGILSQPRIKKAFEAQEITSCSIFKSICKALWNISHFEIKFVRSFEKTSLLLKTDAIISPHGRRMHTSTVSETIPLVVENFQCVESIGTCFIL